MMVDLYYFFPLLFVWYFGARIGTKLIVFGLVTPLDHPPETTQWVTAWVECIIYIIYKEK